MIAVFLIALAARAGYGLVRGGGLAYDDEQWYWTLSRSLAAGDGLVGEFGHRAERMPLYPALLALFDGYRGARAAQWVIGALAASLACLLASRVGAPGWVAGLVVALDPTLIGSASLLLSETLAVTALAGLWLAAWPLTARTRSSVPRWGAVAVLAVLAVYAREASVLFVAALLVFLLLVRRDRQALLGSAAVALIVVLALVPWMLRNERLLGHRVWFTTRGGISLYDGVRPGATGASDLADIKDSPQVRALDEWAWDAHFRGAARREIAQDPWRIVALAPVKLARTWSPVLNAADLSSRTMQIVFAGWYVPLYVLILLGIWSRRRDAVTILGLLLPALCVCVLHSVFVGSVRYRLVALPALAVLAGLGAAWVWSRLRGGRGANGVAS
ncbi:MAG TPA: hypothetical protein P5572_01730 [Phycisphaerae bacterium]|nr:hypothetical protein [Phycisphaerae bacterium]